MRKPKQLTREDVVAILKRQQGERSLRQFAKDLSVSAAYLSDIYLDKRDIGPAILKPLGLTKHVETTVTYQANGVSR